MSVPCVNLLLSVRGADREDGTNAQATCMALTDNFLIYGTENGKVGSHSSPVPVCLFRLAC